MKLNSTDPQIKELNKWMKGLFDYNVVNGKLNRGLFVVKAFQMISNQMKVEIKDEEKHISRIVGWILEILQTFAVIVDDIMDRSTTRRGKPCWYTKVCYPS